MPMGRLRNRYFFVSDLVLLPLAAYLSFVLRLDSFTIGGAWRGCLALVVLSTVLAPLIYHRLGLYARYWPAASVEDLQLLLSAVGLMAVAVLGVYLTASKLIAPEIIMPGSGSVAVIFLLLATAVTAGPRLLTRWLASMLVVGGRRPAGRSRALVIGAGDAGVRTVRELRRNHRLGLDVAGFLDDDPAKQGLRVQGVPVLGTRHDLPRVALQTQAGTAIIAMPSAPGRVVREVLALCGQADVEPKIIPALSSFIDGTARFGQIRDVDIDDLLRRAPLVTDLGPVRSLLQQRRVLITGAGGSIGSELSRQVLQCGPSQLILLGHGENSIFTIQQEIAALARIQADKSGQRPVDVQTVIADLRFPSRLHAVFRQYQPNVVFHAGAHKHVALMESQPGEAVTNNVLGTRNLLEAAQRSGVERFVFLSSDKAVNPTSVMGATKRVGELLVHHAALQTGRPYLVVRFGNVLGSRGSVVLTMKAQIAAGGPITITHPDMTRYFMTIPEAVQLVLQAASIGRGGEVLVFDMGEPVKIVDLARDLVRLSGLELGEDIDIVFTGPGPGEKLTEELFLLSEQYQRTQHEKIFVAANAAQLVPAQLSDEFQALIKAASRDDSASVLSTLRRIVPEFQAQHADSKRRAAWARPMRRSDTSPAWTPAPRTAGE